MTRMDPFQKRPAGETFRRHETEAGVDVHAAAQAARAVPGRAYQRRRSGFAPRFLGDFVSTGARWADGLVTTAYLDEAERANRVGFMHQGRLIRGYSRGAEARLAGGHLPLTSSEHRATREALQSQPGVLTVQPMGVDLHLFLDPDVTSPEKLPPITPFEFQKIQPSLEDVFIALVRRQELAHAA